MGFLRAGGFHTVIIDERGKLIGRAVAAIARDEILTHGAG